MKQQEKREGTDGLLRIKELIAMGWTQGTFARDAQGLPCDTDDPAATQYCLRGALYKTGGDDALLFYICDRVREISPCKRGMGHFNDHTLKTHEEAVAFLDSVLEKWEKEPIDD